MTQVNFKITNCNYCHSNHNCIANDFVDYIRTALELNEPEIANMLETLCHRIQTDPCNCAQSNQKLSTILLSLSSNRKAGRQALNALYPDCADVDFLAIEQAVLWIDASMRANPAICIKIQGAA